MNAIPGYAQPMLGNRRIGREHERAVILTWRGLKICFRGALEFLLGEVQFNPHAGDPELLPVPTVEMRPENQIDRGGGVLIGRWCGLDFQGTRSKGFADAFVA